jgi:hypothetical protein
MSFELQKYSWEKVDNVVYHLSKESGKPSDIEIRLIDEKQITSVKNRKY